MRRIARNGRSVRFADRRRVSPLFPRRRGAGALLLLLALSSAAAVPAEASESSPPTASAGTPTPPTEAAACHWLAAELGKRVPPDELAAMVVRRMTLDEKLGELVLRSAGRYENVNTGVPRLCIPSLTLQDGPSGLAYGDKGVTQLPAPLGVAASFDPGLANEYGQLLGAEARGQGVDVVQAPNLNIDRVPQSGQGFTGFGEDPLLVSTMGAAEIRGIQSRGVMADAKHLAVYSQETNRMVLDERVSPRALQEVYLQPFRAATGAGVASLMCAYPRLNGTFQCQDPWVSQVMRQTGFTGFVRSDQGAVHDPAAALNAGTDLLKPASLSALAAAVAHGSVKVATVDRAVQTVLTEMLAYGVVGRPRSGAPGTAVDSAQHASAALNLAQRSIVLLRNQDRTLPLGMSTLRSVAVIGAAASDAPVTGGHGSSQVIAPFTSTPLAALKAGLGSRVAVSYTDGGSTTGALPTIPAADLAPVGGRSHGLTLTVNRQAGSSTTQATSTSPLAAASVVWQPTSRNSPTKPAANAAGRTASGGTPTNLPRPPAWSGGAQIHLPAPSGSARSTVSLTGTLNVPRSGLYSLSLTGSGSMRVSIGSSTIVDESTNQGYGVWSGTIYLATGHRYPLKLNWVPLYSQGGPRSSVALGMADVSEAIAAAARAARSAQVAIVFAADYSGETFDRPSLTLPGDQNALISAVAAANPRTVVVLDTSGPVLMPWLNRVSSILEAWYPGEQDGAAITSVLTGAFDPTGHLPVTFPAGATDSAISTSAQWPGTGLVSSYTEGLAVGYRYYKQSGTRPLYPFGFGMSYTTFALSNPAVSAGSAAVNVSVTVTNTGRRSGGDVVQAYLTYPTTAAEPPGQLAGFAPITLAAGRSARVALTIPWSRLDSYQPSGWTLVPGRYEVGLGDSSAFQPLHVSFDIPMTHGGASPAVAPGGKSRPTASNR